MDYNERFYLSMYCGLPKKSVKLLWYHVQRDATAPHHRTRQTSNSFTETGLT